MNILPEYLDVKRVLVFNPSFIGDAILTTPLIQLLGKILPSSEIDFCVRPESAPILEGAGNFNVIVFDKRGKDKGITGMIRFARQLKQNNYDLVISPHKSARSMLTLYLARIPVKVGFSESSLSLLLTNTVYRDMDIHEVDRNLSLLSALSNNYITNVIKSYNIKPITYLDKEFAAKARTDFTKSGKKVIGINAGSVWATKRWEVDRFAELIKKLSTKYEIVILGGPGDVGVTDKLLSLIDDVKIHNFANKIPFRQIPAVVASLDLLITNDSSPLHIAVSQNVPTVAIFGATTPSLGFAPYDDISKVVEVYLSCRPCGLHGGNNCPQEHFNCMRNISVEMVYNAVEEILER